MDLRQLKVFAEIAQQKNFTRAAEQLHIAQPAVSMALRKLEEELELTLVNRQDKRVTLTAEGEVFLGHALRILEQCNSARVEMQELRGLLKGEVRLGIPPMMSAYYFPRLIKEFRHLYPHLQLSVYGEGAARIQRMISRGEIDMGVIAGTDIREDLTSRRFLREEIVACVPPGHPLADHESLTHEEFLEQPLILFKEGYFMRELIEELSQDSGVQPEVVFETNLFSLVRSLVREGLGISTLLKMVVQGDSDIRGISFDPPLYLDLLIAWKSESYLSRANHAFVEFLLERADG